MSTEEQQNVGMQGPDEGLLQMRGYGQAVESSNGQQQQAQQHVMSHRDHLQAGYQNQAADLNVMGQPGQGMSAQEMDRSHEGNATMQALEHEQMLRQQMELHPLNTENSQGEEDGKGSKFKPIDIERLSPKSQQRVLRNRQAATRSKAKKKQQYSELRDRKSALTAEMEQLETQHAAAQQRVQQLMLENKALIGSYKPKAESAS